MKKYICLLFISFLPISLSVAQLATSTNGEKSDKLLKSETLFIEGMKYFIAEEYEKSIQLFNEVVTKYEPQAGIYSMLSTAYLRTGNLEKALQNAELTIKLDKSNIYYLKHYADLLAEQKNYKASIDFYEKVISLKPSDPESYIAVANLYITLNRYNDAIRIYDDLEKNIGINEEITRQKQNIYLTQNKVDDAIKEGDRLIESEPMEPDFIVEQAKILIENNKVKAARDMLENYLKTNKSFSEGHVLLAEIYRKDGDLENCYLQLKAAFENQSLGVDTKLRILQSYLLILNENSSEKTLNQVIDLTQQVIKLDSEEARGYVFLGDLYMKKGMTEEARTAYLNSIKYDKSVFEVWLAIVELDNKLGDMDAVIKHSASASEYFPNQTYFWYQNGFGLYLQKKYEDAAISLEEAKSLAFDNDELLLNVLELLGSSYHELKENNDSDKAFEQALKIDPDNDNILNNYSYYLALRKEKMERALELSGRLVKKHPDNVKFADTRAWVLFQSGKFEEALSTLERVISKSDQITGNMLEHYGDILFKNGKKSLAVEQWKNAKMQGNVSPLIDEKINKELYLE